jgi:RNA polymerase primary sigma factor
MKNDISRFQELLREALDKAINQENKIDTKEIKTIFTEMDLNDSQLDRIIDYLSANKIDVTGCKMKAAVKNDRTDKKLAEPDIPEVEKYAEDEALPFGKKVNDSVYLKQYREELKAIKTGEKDEESLLIRKILKGDSTAEGRFIELNLEKVVEIAGEYANRGMTMEDLIQEGNIAMLKALKELPGTKSEAEIIDHIMNMIRKGIGEALEEQQENDDIEHIVLEKSNRIFKALKELEDDLGKKADIHELAEFMNLSEEEILDTLELSGDAIKLEDNHKHEDEDSVY